MPVVPAAFNHGVRGDNPIDQRSPRRPARRSFLARVGGGFALGAAALVTGCRPAPSGLSDCDDGANADARGNGRTGERSGFTDSDSGTNADRPGCGRGGAGASVTDSDRGRLADPAGRGRGNAERYSDNDIGLAADPIGRGRRRGERRP